MKWMQKGSKLNREKVWIDRFKKEENSPGVGVNALVELGFDGVRVEELF